MSIKIQKFNLQNNSYIRFKKYGKGQPILLLHTFRNRLEYCENVANLLKNNYSVYIIDLPGFGDSSINVDTQYTQEFFTDSIILCKIAPVVKIRILLFPCCIIEKPSSIQLLLLILGIIDNFSFSIRI